MTTYDVIGDVHGYAQPLERLLGKLGYREVNGSFRHSDPDHQVVFLGDLIDRGPSQLRTLEIARAMVDAGNAQVVMGNHEFNAIAWSTELEGGNFARPHSTKNRAQHQQFLDEVGEGSLRHREWIDWFRTIPMWADLGGLRIVHACWDPASMDVLGGAELKNEHVAAPKASPHYEAIEIVLKGPEVDLGQLCYLDKGGHERRAARFRWWDQQATTLADGAEIPAGVTSCDGGPFGPLPEVELQRDSLPDAPIDVPVLFGHYWRSGTPTTYGPLSACLDWSVAAGGSLVAYRWSGERALSDENLVWVEAER